LAINREQVTHLRRPYTARNDDSREVIRVSLRHRDP